MGFDHDDRNDDADDDRGEGEEAGEGRRLRAPVDRRRGLLGPRDDQGREAPARRDQEAEDGESLGHHSTSSQAIASTPQGRPHLAAQIGP